MNYQFDELTKYPDKSVTRRGVLKKFGFSLAGITLASLLTNFGASAAPSYRTIDYPGGVFTVLGDINTKEDIVGRYTDAANITHGFLLKNRIFTDITVPGAVWTRAIGINRDGDIVGDYSLTDPSGNKDVHAYLLQQGTFFWRDFPGASLTVAQGINRNGDIVGLYLDNAGSKNQGAARFRGFLLSGGVFTTIDFPGAQETQAWRINDNGQVVGRYLAPGGSKYHVFRLVDGNFTTVEDVPDAVETAPGGLSHLGGLNSNGDIVSNYSSSTPFHNLTKVKSLNSLHGFVLSEGSYTSIDFPDALTTLACGINDGGLVVGTYQNYDGTVHGYLRVP